MDRRRRETPNAALLPHSLPGAAAKGRSPNAVPLKAGIYLSTAEGDHSLVDERLLIGRAAHCRIVVLDPLVSREHALITVSPDSVVILDLKSANGVYVNNARVSGPCTLYDGDRILVGTHEMAVFALTPDTRPPSAVRWSSIQPAPGASAGAATDRAEALAVLGRLADRMLAQGQPADAERVLADHLAELLAAARAGAAVPPATCRSAASYALAFAQHLRDGRWVDFVFELHFHTEVLLAPELLLELERAMGACPTFDRARFGTYLSWVKGRLPELGLPAMRVLQALERAQVP